MDNKSFFAIDALKAFAMLLVIIGHIPLYCIYRGEYDEVAIYSYYMPFVNTFHMPLFIFLSGLVTNFETFQVRRRMKVLIPFIIIGLTYTFVRGMGVRDFILSESKLGYWYLLVLTYFYIVLWLIRKIKINFWIGIIIAEFFFWVIFHIAPNFSQHVLCFTKAIFLWPFFIIGVIVKRYDLIHKLLSNSWIAVLSIMIYLFLYVVRLPMSGWVLPLSMICFLVVLFHKIDAITWISIEFKKMVSLIGRNTLQIYTLHYFLLNLLANYELGDFLIVNNMRWIELFLSPIVAFLLAILCIVLSRCLYKLHLGIIFGR